MIKITIVDIIKIEYVNSLELTKMFFVADDKRIYGMYFHGMVNDITPYINQKITFI